MAKRRNSYGRGRTNYDSGDGLKPNSIKDVRLVSKYIYSFSFWENENITYEDPKDGKEVFAGINKRLRRLNIGKCRRINGYNGKIHGR